MTICPKCSYVRQPSDTAPDYECPKCGVVYSKVLPQVQAATAAPNPSPVERVRQTDNASSELPPQPGRWIDDHQNRILLAAVVVSFVFGYVAGREHVKYEFRSALAEAAQGFQQAIVGGFAGALEKPAAKPKASSEQPIVPTLVEKGFRDEEYGQDTITLAVDFANRTGRNIRAFDGSLVFADLLGNEIMSAKIVINDPVAAGATYSWRGGISYNQFIASHQSLRDAEPQNMKVQLRAGKVLFSDGQTKEYNQ